ncbi:MAG: DUF444 family protein [Candidatus Paceibacterota bacterium]|jgi:hypothetical protein
MSVSISVRRKSPEVESDANRHREKLNDDIKRQLPRVLSERGVEILSGDGKKKILIKLRSIELPDLRPGSRKGGGGSGVGQDVEGGKSSAGEPKPADQKPGKKDDTPGRHEIEVEFTRDELIDLIFEDLELPNIKDKPGKDGVVIKTEIRIKGITDQGPQVLLSRSHTAREGIKRFFAFLKILQQKSGKDRVTCFAALRQVGGKVEKALELLADPSFTHSHKRIVPFPIIYNEDLRYHRLKTDAIRATSAVAFFLMDISGSMNEKKKYMARAISCFVKIALERNYKKVTIIFIMHDTEAKITDEKTFFSTTTSGSTHSYTAIRLAKNLIRQKYNTKNYNVFVFYYTDGEDQKTPETLVETRLLFAEGINLYVYCEVLDGKQTQADPLFDEYAKSFDIAPETIEGVEVADAIDSKQFPFIGLRFSQKNQVRTAVSLIMGKRKGRK